MHSLRVHPGLHCICRLASDATVPAWALSAGFCSVTRTAEELSIVCREDSVPAGVQSNHGWRLLSVQGPLDLSMVGVLAGLTATLARANVSLFAVSTFDTDYLLVRETDLRRAVEALEVAGYGLDSSSGGTRPDTGFL